MYTTNADLFIKLVKTPGIDLQICHYEKLMRNTFGTPFEAILFLQLIIFTIMKECGLNDKIYEDYINLINLVYQAQKE